MKTILFAVTISALFLVAIAGTQDAFASPGHSAFGKVPGVGGTCVGCDMAINIGVSSPEANGVRGNCIAVAEDPNEDMSFPASLAALTTRCVTGFADNDGQWVLVDSADLPALSPVCAYFPAGTTGHVTLRMGPGPAPGVSAVVGSVIPFECSDAPVGSNPPDFSGAGIEGTPVFANILTSAVGIPNANIHNFYNVVSPGCDDAGAPVNNGICGTGDLTGNVFESYFVSNPMAGEVIPTSSISLVLAGITSSAMWVLASLGAVAGVSFAILRLQTSGRNF